LTSDIVTFAKTVSGYIRTSASADDIGAATAETILAAWGPPGVVASLIIPADHSWSETASAGPVVTPKIRTMPDLDRLAKAAELVRQPGTAILLGGTAVNRKALDAAARLSAATGVKIVTARNAGINVGGRGSFNILQVPYFPEGALPMFADVRNLILIEAERPVSFFAYPGIPSEMTAPGCVDLLLASRSEDGTAAMLALADGCPKVDEGPHTRPVAPTQDETLTLDHIGLTLAALMPENTLVSDEMVSSAAPVHAQLKSAAAFDYLPVTGGSIGQGLPVAVGAAMAAPHRRVVSIEADGSAMYTLQALWTMVREKLDVTVVILANERYKILEIEMRRTGANGFGPMASDLIDISRPDLDFVKMGQGMGVDCSRATTAREFSEQFADAMKTGGPRLIEACIE
ncbi:MAG: putative acetolactate synthase large subunit IlvX, partial [Bryobacterales bacterium]|nr:putative acetolactate synthase large subunit IlvX [Bryobacterales bacterium]